MEVSSETGESHTSRTVPEKRAAARQQTVSTKSACRQLGVAGGAGGSRHGIAADNPRRYASMIRMLATGVAADNMRAVRRALRRRDSNAGHLRL